VSDRFEIETKALLNLLPSVGIKCEHDGGRVAFGYRPDRVYIGRQKTWVVELESSTSRKGYLGGYIKAQKYIHQECGGLGALLFIINEQRCNADTIREQLQHYHDWLSSLGVPVQPTYLLNTSQLKAFAKSGVTLFSDEFLRCALEIG
jgi:hypothetical protein